jgi:NAD(P)-dependent dehydrogenase (short-subunit alcohol dehydrogenase family)
MKTVAITGCTSGIGKATVEGLLEQDFKVYALVRNTEKAKSIFGDRVFVVKCDLEDFDSIKSAADWILANVRQLDVLINNAGAMFKERKNAGSGYERTLMINHIAPFYLTQLLMPTLLKSKSRVIGLSSAVHPRYSLRWNDIEMKRKYSPMKSYANAKLYTIWFIKMLHIKYAKYGLTSYAVHPGVIATGFGDHLGTVGKMGWQFMKLFLKSSKKGAETSIYLARESDIESLSGNYFVNKEVTKPDPIALDFNYAEKMWNRTMQMCDLESKVEE